VNFFATAQILLKKKKTNKNNQSTTMDVVSTMTGVGGGCGVVASGINNKDNY